MRKIPLRSPNFVGLVRESVEGVYTEFYSCGRIPLMSVHISVYIMYTAWNRRYTGRYVEGVYKKFYSCGKVPSKVPSSSGHIAVYSMHTGRIKGYTECGVKGKCTDFVYLVNNEPWYFYWFSTMLIFKHRQIKTWSTSILNSTQWKLSRASLARTIQMKSSCGIPRTAILRVKCPLTAFLWVPFSLASGAKRTWNSLAAQNDLSVCYLRWCITSFFQALNHFFYILFEVHFHKWEILLDLLQPAVLPQVPLVLA